MRRLGILLTVAMAAAPVLARAQPIEGFYISGGVGLHATQNVGIDSDGSLGGRHLRLEQQPGFAGIVSLGYGVGGGGRVEIEGDFNQNSLKQIGRVPFVTNSSGNIRHYGVMANALFDMDIRTPWAYPYIGAGIGYQITKFDNISVTQSGGPLGVQSNDSKGAFAAQAILGVSFPVPNMPGLSITPEYRFMDIFGGEKFNATVTNGRTSSVRAQEVRNQYDHTFLIGVRYAFDVPPPAATATTAPPAAPAARSYLVFFDWDKANLTDRARGIIRDAATNVTKVAYTRIEVNGNADTSGTHAYNQGLSQRRADAVAAELVKDGVPKAAISITAFGDTHLLVPTGPGVREPQNRRVEIVIK
jgi:OmpA-OmpF porin, OOP family